jgi:tetratricopeptide (TPR) repeat protein
VVSWRPFGAWRAASIYRDELADRVRAEEALADCAKKWSATDWGYVCRVELGHLRVLRENHRGAIDAFRGALELRPRGVYAETCLFESGRAYLALDEPEQARMEWQELLQTFPSTPLAAQVSLEVARSFDIEGKHRQAVTAYRALIQRFEGHSVVFEARFGEGENLEQLGQLEDALEVFRLLIDSHPNPAAVRVKVGAIGRRIGRRSMNQMSFGRAESGRPAQWDAEQGIAPAGDQAVGEPMETTD